MRMLVGRFKFGFIAVAVLGTLLLAGYVSASANATSSPGTRDSVGQVTALPDYHVSVFARGTQTYFAPDSLVDDGSHVFIDYQNTTAKDCSDAATANSTVVEYTPEGKVVKSFKVPGHSDGMREDLSSHLLWVT